MTDQDGKEISVPINAAYNHHFDGMLNNGKKSRLERLQANDPRLETMAMHSGSLMAAGGSAQRTTAFLGSPLAAQIRRAGGPRRVR